MSFSVLDAMEDGDSDENGKEDDNPCVITLHDEETKKATSAQLRNQIRIKNEIKDFILQGLGGVPENYLRVEVKKLWGNKFRANLITIDKKGAIHYNHSWLIHYQKDAIQPDKQTPLVKLYDNYEKVFK